MAGTIKVENITGPTSGVNADTVTIPSGQSLIMGGDLKGPTSGSDANKINIPSGQSLVIGGDITANGNTVIDSTGALKNITSVDATTVSALGSAGVGGETTLLVDNASVGTGGQFEVSFTAGHKYYVVSCSKLKCNSTSTKLYGRYKDFNNNVISASDNIRNYLSHSNGANQYNRENEVRFSNASMNNLKNQMDITVTFYNPYSTTNRSWGAHDAMVDNTETDTSIIEANQGVHSLGMQYNSGNIVRTNGFVFYWSSGNFADGRYSVWGIS